MSNGFLLDTNHIGHAVRADSVVRERIAEYRRQGARLGTCVPVLCEIEAGIRQVRDAEVYRENLDRLLRQIRIWPIAPSTAKLFGELHFELKRRGRVLSQVDLMLAALAIEMNLVIATSDQDFTALSSLKVVNWLEPQEPA